MDEAYKSGQLYLFAPALIPKEELFEAYYACLKHKRYSKSAMEFELDLEHNLFSLLDDINNFTYKPEPYHVFIIDYPVKREVFAASFRDRIVHHLVVNAINPYMEKRLIYDCYACRVGKGTHFGINRLRHFMVSSTSNWKEEAWCLKMDIKGFFMSIDRQILWTRLRTYLLDVYKNDNLPIILYLLEQIIFTDPTLGCKFCSPEWKWDGLASTKSLFTAPQGKGLPIGNLTSQIMANFYLSILDHFVKHDLSIKMYGRYVDDFFLIHKEKEYLKQCMQEISGFLEWKLRLKLSEKKVALQRVRHGVKFLGVVVEPGHVNVSRRTVGLFYGAVRRVSAQARDHRQNKAEMQHAVASINSYLGILGHWDTFRVRREGLQTLDWRFERRVRVDDKKISI